MDDMLLKCIRINEDIVEIHEAENIQKLMETIVRIYLKEYEGSIAGSGSLAFSSFPFEFDFEVRATTFKMPQKR